MLGSKSLLETTTAALEDRSDTAACGQRGMMSPERELAPKPTLSLALYRRTAKSTWMRSVKSPSRDSPSNSLASPLNAATRASRTPKERLYMLFCLPQLHCLVQCLPATAADEDARAAVETLRRFCADRDLGTSWRAKRPVSRLNNAVPFLCFSYKRAYPSARELR
eukprot:scaffold7613_cov258-Pinguiococcus_pyrenoidosus.AAC.6